MTKSVGQTKQYFNGAVVVRPACKVDAQAVAAQLRDIEVQELWQAYRKKPLEVCTQAVNQSELALAIVKEGKTIAIFGARTVGMLDRRGIIWLLATDEVKAIAVAMQKYTRAYVGAMLEFWDSLENHVHHNNKVSLRWLKAAGFTLSEPAAYGFDGEDFIKVVKKLD